jgi:hypothetical protein
MEILNSLQLQRHKRKMIGVLKGAYHIFGALNLAQVMLRVKIASILLYFSNRIRKLVFSRIFLKVS